MTRTTDRSFILSPSKIHGVGVFAVHDIERDTKLRLFARNEKVKFVGRVPKEPFGNYCVPCLCGRYARPVDFGRMSIGWYLNHSVNPNAIRRDYEYYAVRDIKAGEEITIDYRTL
jgi:SET domain-containing protein